jgi:hypothetical protein
LLIPPDKKNNRNIGDLLVHVNSANLTFSRIRPDDARLSIGHSNRDWSTFKRPLETADMGTVGRLHLVAEAVRRCGYGARSMIISVGLRDLGEPGTMAN